jgi:amidophosphoribosyltransferase
MMLADRLWHASRRAGLPAAAQELLDDVDGAINMLALTGAGQFLAARDRHGFRPLHWGIADDVLFVSSEDHVLRDLGCRSRELEAGGLITVRDGSVCVEATGRRRLAACSFEFVYFAHSAASFEHRTVQGRRERFGFLLADEETSVTDNAVVIPIPATGAVAGRAFAQRLGLPVQEGIVTDRYHGRTFIGQPDATAQTAAQAALRVAKHHVVPDCALGKDAFLVDDSMVRGATLQQLVGAFRRVARPRSVHVRLAAPPVLHPCFYGIDIPDRSELFAARLHLEDERTRAIGLAKLAAALGVDTVRFLSIGGFRRALAPGEDRFCYACLTGDYPTPAGARLAERSVAGQARVSRCG